MLFEFAEGTSTMMVVVQVVQICVTSLLGIYGIAAALNGFMVKKLNIVNGIDDKNFGVGKPISRQDMSVMIYNIMTMKNDVSVSKDKFADDSSIAEYASDAVYSMKSLEVLNGYEDGTFKPLGQLTRAEAAKVITLIANIQ